jgi:hypothetical protein
LIACPRRWFAAQLRPPKDYKQQQDAAAAAAADGTPAAADAANQRQQQTAAGSSSSTTAGTSSSSTAAAGSSSSDVSRELAGLMDAGQDKNSAIYKAAVRIQSRFRYVACKRVLLE